MSLVVRNWHISPSAIDALVAPVLAGLSDKPTPMLTAAADERVSV
jgi:hypothetical protein